jgi:dienelactone hydrolase
LARAGFIVVAQFHGNVARTLLVRPVQVAEAFHMVVRDIRFQAHADPARTGATGFSLGGAVALIVAGAVPNEAHLRAYCTR